MVDNSSCVEESAAKHASVSLSSEMLRSDSPFDDQTAANIARAFLRDEVPLQISMEHNYAAASFAPTSSSFSSCGEISSDLPAQIYESMSFTRIVSTRNRPCLVTEIDSFTKETIRRTIYGFGKSEGCMLNLSNLLAKLKQEGIFGGGRESLRKIVQNMGFRYRKTQNNRKVLQEREDIKEKRFKYLRNMSEHRRMVRKIFYTDETFINLNLHSSKEWTDATTCGQTPPIGKGSMFIIIHCGGAQGWVDGALKMWRAGSGDADYHSKMDHESFANYINDFIIPKLDKGSVLVLDNASYHNFQRCRRPQNLGRRRT